MECFNDLNDFIRSIERKELNEEQQLLLSHAGSGSETTVINSIEGCTNNCHGGNCGNCVKGCGTK